MYVGYKKDFNVNITRLSTAVAQRGFGTILILSDEGAADLKKYVEVSDVAEDFEIETKTYKLAQALFGQGVEEVMVIGTDEGDYVGTLNNATEFNDSFFGVVSTNNEESTITEISEWIDTQEKVYAVTSDSKTISNPSEQTILAYHPGDFLAEKSLAYMLTKKIGSVDLDGKSLSGITSSDVTATEYGVLKENNVNVALEKFGNVVIDGGNTAGGEAIDVILAEFWIKIRMEEDLAALKLNTPKIPYTDAGVALLISVVNTRLRMAVDNGIIALDADGLPEFKISYVPTAEVPMNDKANRDYSYLEWSAVLAGAIRTGEINGVLTL